MPSRKKRGPRRRPQPGYRRLSSRTNLATLQATFLTVKAEKLAQRLGDLGGRVPKAPTVVAKEKSIIDAFLEGFERGKICGQLEQTLDSAIDFLRENGNNPALQEECDSLRKAAVDTLNIYANNCGV